jgi:thymidylate kinase
LIILEGCDGVGKSTLAEAVQMVMRQRGMMSTVLKASQPKPGVHPLNEYAGPIVAHPGARLICDRWHIGEHVYGPIYRDGSRITWAQRAWLDAFLIGRGASFVHVTASHATVLERCRSRGEDFLKEEDIQRVLNNFGYQTIDRRYWRTVDTTGVPLDEMSAIANRLVDVAMGRHQAMAPVIELGTDYVGPLRPKVLLVADRPSLGDGAPPAYAALTPWNGNSAAYLFDALYDAGVLTPLTIPDIGWVNSYNTDLYKLHQLLGEPPVITLGAEADRRANAHRVQVLDSVSHPQYWRRFRHKRRIEYGNQIRDILFSASVPS